MSNLKLWDLVEKTDPKYTKEFKGKGGFKGTAVCAQSQRKKATEMFGRYGAGWGVSAETYDVLHLSDDPHNSILVYKATLFYHFDDGKGEFPIVSDIALWQYSNQHKSWSPTTDPHKKVRTDAMTKGLSELGFNADVFMGEFDDNKHVRNQEHKQPQQPVAFKDADLVTNLKKCKSIEDVDAVHAEYKRNYALNTEWGTLLNKRINQAKEHILKEEFKGEEV